ncbi:hypothetical protein B4946_18430 [Vibrio cholerae]|nr:hypothetical protein [Vibrio cholerae]
MRCVSGLRWFAVASVLRCSHLNRALTLICIYINKFNRLTDFDNSLSFWLRKICLYAHLI